MRIEYEPPVAMVAAVADALRQTCVPTDGLLDYEAIARHVTRHAGPTPDEREAAVLVAPR